MLSPERHQHILAELENREAVRVTELAAALNVSEMTIRRDIELLATRGSLRRIHGGARRNRTYSAMEPGFAANATREQGAKTAIARAAVEMITPGMTIALTGGSSTYHLAQQIGAIRGLTVVTNSLKVADAIHRKQGRHDGNGSRTNRDIRASGVSQIGREDDGGAGTGNDRAQELKPTVIITGGERTASEALVGPVATGSIAGLHMDLCFMGVHGLDIDHGLSTPNLLEAETNRAFAAATDELVVLADHTKFGITSLARIVALERVNVLITDADPDTGGDRYRDQVHRIIVAPYPLQETSAL